MRHPPPDAIVPICSVLSHCENGVLPHRRHSRFSDFLSEKILIRLFLFYRISAALLPGALLSCNFSSEKWTQVRSFPWEELLALVSSPPRSRSTSTAEPRGPCGFFRLRDSSASSSFSCNTLLMLPVLPPPCGKDESLPHPRGMSLFLRQPDRFVLQL